MCLEDHRIVPICLDTSLHNEETREDSDRVHGNPFYEKSHIDDRYEIKKKEERILVKKVSSVSSSFYSDYKFEISVDEIRYVYFEIKEKREKQKNIEIFSFMQITINLKFYLVCKNLVF